MAIVQLASSHYLQTKTNVIFVSHTNYKIQKIKRANDFLWKSNRIFKKIATELLPKADTCARKGKIKEYHSINLFFFNFSMPNNINRSQNWNGYGIFFPTLLLNSLKEYEAWFSNLSGTVFSRKTLVHVKNKLFCWFFHMDRPNTIASDCVHLGR